MKNRLSLISSLCVFLLSPVAEAEPLVQWVDGKITHEEYLSIKGDSFGDKASARPLIFDTLETGEFSPGWKSTYDLQINQVSTRHKRSSYDAKTSFEPGSLDGRFRPPKKESQRWYLDYWFYLRSNWNWGKKGSKHQNNFLSTINLARFWNPATLNEDLTINLLAWKNEGQILANTSGQDFEDSFLENFTRLLEKEKWHHFQAEFAENSSPRAKDGVLRLWLNGQKVYEKTDLLTREDPVDPKGPVAVGFSVEWTDQEKREKVRGRNDFQMDDAYVDANWARVEIGDSYEYAKCRRKEIQLPLKWTPTNLSIQFNQGSFEEGDIVFLYVIDANGQPAKNGTPLVIGESGPFSFTDSINPETIKIPEGVLKVGASPFVFSDKIFEFNLYREDGSPFLTLTRRKNAPLTWDGSNQDGKQIRPGRYLAKLIDLRGNGVFQQLSIERAR